jgi:hypothetical protein
LEAHRLGPGQQRRVIQIDTDAEAPGAGAYAGRYQDLGQSIAMRSSAVGAASVWLSAIVWPCLTASRRSRTASVPIAATW